MNAETLKHYGPCSQCGTWHGLAKSCIRCLTAAANAQVIDDGTVPQESETTKGNN